MAGSWAGVESFVEASGPAGPLKGTMLTPPGRAESGAGSRWHGAVPRLIVEETETKRGKSHTFTLRLQSGPSTITYKRSFVNCFEEKVGSGREGRGA